MENVIECIGVHKHFVKPRSYRTLLTHPFQRAERIRALRGVDLAVRRSEILGLLGPNGAGKTTLIKIFCCLILPDEGSAKINGVETIHEQQVKPVIGLVNSDERSFYWRLSARENLRFFARLYDVPAKKIESRISELLERVDMVEVADRAFSGYSSGMKQRIAIARALLHDPPVLFMDEPTRSLDPAAAKLLRKFVQEELKERDHKTILLATHDMREAEALSDRIAIMSSGCVRQVGTVDEVRRWGIQEHLFLLETDAGGPDPRGPFRIVSEETVNSTRKLTLSLDEGARLDDLLRAVMAQGIVVHGCDRVESDLEAAFSRILAQDDEA